MTDRKITIVNSDGSFTEVECGDVMKDGFGNTVGGSINGGVGVPISSLGGQSIQLFDKPIDIHNVNYAPAGAGQNASVEFALDLAGDSGEPLPDNAVRAILHIHNEFKHAFTTSVAKEADIWANSYPSGGDFTGFDINDNFTTRTFIPTGAKLDASDVTVFTAYGRGGRMLIEQDRAKIISGVRHGHTLGSPIGMTLENKDWANWEEAMAIDPLEGPPQSPRTQRITRLRPGHADLPGAMKYGFEDVRNVLERASARETAAIHTI